MEHRLLPQSTETLRLMEHVLLLPHVFEKLDSPFVGYYNVHVLFNRILLGDFLVFGSFEEPGGKLCGLCWGQFNEYAEFIAHAAYERHTDAGSGILGCIDVLKQLYPLYTAVVCFLPMDNRAIRRTVKRIGFREEGPEEGAWMTDRQGKRHQCIRYALYRASNPAASSKA